MLTECSRWKRISGIEETIEGMNTSVEENVKSKIILAQNLQKIWNAMKRLNVRIGIKKNKKHRKKAQKIFSTE